jgi:hypothetical protein
MGENGNAYMIFVGKPEAKIPLRRPTHGLVAVKMDLRDIG